MNRIDRAIELSQKKADLLVELKDSIAYENCDYDVRKQPDRKGRFFLFRISDGRMVADGSANEIHRYITRHSSPSKVYNFSLLISEPCTETRTETSD